MTQFRELLAYILIRCQKTIPLSTANFILYLADWKQAIDSQNHKTITQTFWTKRDDKPYNDELYKLFDDDLFEIKEIYSARENSIISIRDARYHVNLDDNAKAIVDFIISKVNTKTWEEIANLVASTLPMLVGEYSNKLPLEKLARIYAEEIRPQMNNRELQAA